LFIGIESALTSVRKIRQQHHRSQELDDLIVGTMDANYLHDLADCG
jgi:hypothetical protein